MSKKESLKGLLKAAKEGLAANDFKAALKACKYALKRKEELEDEKNEKLAYMVYVLTGKASFGMGGDAGVAQAIASYKKASELNPKEVVAWQGLLEAYTSCENETGVADALYHIASVLPNDHPKWVDSAFQLCDVLWEANGLPGTDLAEALLDLAINEDDIAASTTTSGKSAFGGTDDEKKSVSSVEEHVRKETKMGQLLDRILDVCESGSDSELRALRLLYDVEEQKLRRFYASQKAVRTERQIVKYRKQVAESGEDKQESAKAQERHAAKEADLERRVTAKLEKTLLEQTQVDDLLTRILAFSKKCSLPAYYRYTQIARLELRAKYAADADVFASFLKNIERLLWDALKEHPNEEFLYQRLVSLLERPLTNMVKGSQTDAEAEQDRERAAKLQALAKRAAHLFPFSSFGWAALAAHMANSRRSSNKDRLGESLLSFARRRANINSAEEKKTGCTANSENIIRGVGFRSYDGAAPGHVCCSRDANGLSLFEWCAFARLCVASEAFQFAVGKVKYGFEAILNRDSPFDPRVERARRDLELSLGEAYLGIGIRKLDQAVLIFEKTLATDEDDLRSLRGLSKAQLKYPGAPDPRRFDAAEEYCRRILALVPDDDWSIAFRGRVAYLRAVREFRLVYGGLGTDPLLNVCVDDAAAAGNTALASRMEALLDEAASLLEKAITLDPTSATHHYELGRICMVRGGTHRSSKGGAYRSAMAAAKLDPSLAAPFSLLGLFFLHVEGKATAAERCFLKALKLYPSDEVAGPSMVDLLIGRGERQALAPLLSSAIDTDAVCAWAWFTQGRLLFDEGEANYPEVVTCFQNALRGDPKHASVWEQLAETYYGMGKYMASVRSFEKAIELDPALPTRLVREFMLAKTLLTVGLTHRCVSTIRAVLYQLAGVVSDCKPTSSLLSLSERVVPFILPALKVYGDVLYCLAKEETSQGSFARANAYIIECRFVVSLLLGKNELGVDVGDDEALDAIANHRGGEVFVQTRTSTASDESGSLDAGNTDSAAGDETKATGTSDVTESPEDEIRFSHAQLLSAIRSLAAIPGVGAKCDDAVNLASLWKLYGDAASWAYHVPSLSAATGAAIASGCGGEATDGNSLAAAAQQWDDPAGSSAAAVLLARAASQTLALTLIADFAYGKVVEADADSTAASWFDCCVAKSYAANAATELARWARRAGDSWSADAAHPENIPKTADELSELATFHLDKAINAAHEALSRDPLRSRYWNALGQLDTRFSVKLHCFSRASELDDKVGSLLNLALLYIKAGDKPSARACLERAQTIDPSSPSLWVGHGLYNLFFHTSEGHAQAHSSFLTSNTLAASEWSRFGVGAAAVSEGHFHDARFFLQRYLTQQPGDICARNLLAIAHEEIGEFDVAVAELQSGLVLIGSASDDSDDRTRATLLLNLLRVAGKAHNVHALNKAKSTLSSLLEGGSGVFGEAAHCSAMLTLGRTYLVDGDDTTASEWFNKVIVSCSDLVGTHDGMKACLEAACVELARLGAQRGSVDDTKAAIEAGLKVLPGSTLLLSQFVILLSSIGDKEEGVKNAWSVVRRMRAQSPFEHRQYVEWVSAYVAQASGDHVAAQRHLSKAIHLDPVNTDMWTSLAQLVVDHLPWDMQYTVEALSSVASSNLVSLSDAQRLRLSRAQVQSGLLGVDSLSRSSEHFPDRTPSISVASRLYREDPTSVLNRRLYCKALYAHAVSRAADLGGASHPDAVPYFRSAASYLSSLLGDTSVEDLTAPEAFALHLLLSDCFAVDGKREEALASVEAARVLEPVVLSDKAVDASSVSVGDVPFGCMVARQVARVHAAFGEFEESAKRYLSALSGAGASSRQSSTLWLEIASVYHADKKHHRAEQSLWAAVHIGRSATNGGGASSASVPSELLRQVHFEALLRLARLYFFSKQYKPGTTCVEEAVSLYPNSSAANFVLGVFQRKSRKTSPAVASMSTALQTSEEPRFVSWKRPFVPLANFNLALLHVRQKEYVEAESDLFYELEVSPDLAAVYYQLGLVAELAEGERQGEASDEAKESESEKAESAALLQQSIVEHFTKAASLEPNSAVFRSALEEAVSKSTSSK